MKKTKIIIDTDPLSDVDDAIALAYCALNPKLDIKGITTVHAMPKKRARFAKKMMINLGKPDVIVAAGKKFPLNSDVLWFHGFEGKGILSKKDEYLELYGSTTDLLYNKIKDNKNDISLLCIASLTNIAKLFQEKPETKQWIKQIYFMGGAFKVNDETEYFIPDSQVHNVKVDPEAAHIVFDSKIPMKIITREDSKKIIFYEDDFKHIKNLNNTWAKDIYTNARHFMEIINREHCYMYDPLTAIAITHPEFIEMKTIDHISKSTGVVDTGQVKKHLLDTIGVKNERNNS